MCSLMGGSGRAVRFGFAFDRVLDTHPTNVYAYFNVTEHHMELLSNDCRKHIHCCSISFCSVDIKPKLSLMSQQEKTATRGCVLKT